MARSFQSRCTVCLEFCFSKWGSKCSCGALTRAITEADHKDWYRDASKKKHLKKSLK